jgi:hypothetical protein
MLPVHLPEEEVVVEVAEVVQRPERSRLDLQAKAVVARSRVWASVHARQAGDVAEKSRF